MAMIQRLRKVDYWYAEEYLQNAFANLLRDDNVFEHIYVPITLPDDQGVSTTEWVDVGFDYTDLAEFYAGLYSGNYIAVPADTISNRIKLLHKMRSVYQLNKYKYLKLIELMGYKYNPLFNVDGVELYGVFENNGTNDITSTTTGQYSTENAADNDSKPSVEHQVQPYDGTGLVAESKDITSGKSTATTKFGGTSEDDDYKQKTEIIHNNAKNTVSGSNEGVDYNVNAADNPFGEALTGADRYHVEKKVRQGNIGVTKTQELIAAERENLKYNLYNVFFEDLNEQILVGIYDY